MKRDIRKLLPFTVFSVFLAFSACTQELSATRRTAAFDMLPPELEQLKIVFFADTHLREQTIGDPLFAELVRAVNAENADLVLIGGDTVDRLQKGRLAEFRTRLAGYLAQFKGAHGVYAVFGNHELFAGKEFLASCYEEAGVKMLENKLVILPVKGKRLCLFGMGEARWDEKSRRLPKECGAIPENAIIIILSHRPEPFDRFPASMRFLLLAGHYHGGLIDLPFAPPGALLNLRRREHPAKYVKGFFTDGKKQMFVTTGVSGGGHSALRVNVPREIVVITLTNGTDGTNGMDGKDK